MARDRLLPIAVGVIVAPLPADPSEALATRTVDDIGNETDATIQVTEL